MKTQVQGTMSKKRIVVTGLGVVSCFGNDVDTFYDQLLKGVSGISLIDRFPCDEFTTKFAGEIKNFETGDYIEKKQARRIDSFIAYGMVAAKKALESANLATIESRSKLNLSKCGVLIGSGMGGMEVFSEGINNLSQKKKITPFLIPFILTNMAGGLLAMDIGFMGPNYSISTACASSNNAIIAAANHIQKGDADMMICGGTEAPIVPIGIAGFCACKALSQRNDAPQKASRPWDQDRDGFVMGEGSGVIILETLEHAIARNAPIYAEYMGGGISCDAYHITEPRSDGGGVALCIQNALQDAGICAEDVNYVNAHATSTPAGDMAEIGALKKFFKPETVINSTKSMIGHLLGAAGGIEAVATIKAIMTGWVHPTINLENPEPDLGFDAPTQAKELKIRNAISNSFGFGGHNASVIFAPYRE